MGALHAVPKQPFMPEEQLLYVCGYLAYKLRSSFYCEYLSRIKAGYAWKRVMLIENS